MSGNRDDATDHRDVLEALEARLIRARRPEVEPPFAGDTRFDVEGSFDNEAGGTFTGTLALQLYAPQTAPPRGILHVTLLRAGQQVQIGPGAVTLLNIGNESISFTVGDSSGGAARWSFSGSWIGDEIKGHHILRQVTIPGQNEGSWKASRR